MFSKSSAWQLLRGESLRFIPPATKHYFKTGMSLREWRARGCYTVSSSDNKQITLVTSQAEIAAVILTEVELLLDHAAENRAALKLDVANAHWHSPAWVAVTAYYWSFFSVLALTRLVGSSTLFLDKVAISNLATLAPASTGKPSAGTLFFELQPQTNGDCEIHLLPSGRNNHDAVWYCLHQLTKKTFAATQKNSTANVVINEHRFWWCLNESSKILGYQWPSEIRNNVNYRPGYAYTQVIKGHNVKIAPHLNAINEFDFEGLLDEFESEVLSIQSDVTRRTDLNVLLKLLILNAASLSLAVEALHAEVLDRIGGNKGWLRMRKTFLEAQCRSENGNFWPLAGQI